MSRTDDHAAVLPVLGIFDADHAERRWEILGYARDHCPVALPPIDLDPPLHADFRRFLNPYMHHPEEPRIGFDRIGGR